MKNVYLFTRIVSFSMLLFVIAACTLTITPAPAPVSDELATPVPSDPASDNSIQNIVWQWVGVRNKATGEVTEVPNPQDYTIIFRDNGDLSGQADCNSFTGTYTQEGGFSIQIGASTMAACGDDSLDAEYMQLLSEIVAGGPDGSGGLALETAGGEKRMSFLNGGAAPN